jgi:hypothetical protein
VRRLRLCGLVRSFLAPAESQALLKAIEAQGGTRGSRGIRSGKANETAHAGVTRGRHVSNAQRRCLIRHRPGEKPSTGAGDVPALVELTG